MESIPNILKDVLFNSQFDIYFLLWNPRNKMSDQMRGILYHIYLETTHQIIPFREYSKFYEILWKIVGYYTFTYAAYSLFQFGIIHLSEKQMPQLSTRVTRQNPAELFI